jgi:hypothetical protein
VFKQSIEINPSLVRLSAGIPAAGLGGLLGYLRAPKEHRYEGMARGAGTGYLTGTGLGVGAELASRAAPDGEATMPYMLSGALAGGAAGFGVGKMTAGTPPWEERRKFREELLSLLREESSKLKSDFRPRSKRPEAIQKISMDVTQFAAENPELALVPLGGAAGAAATDERASFRKKLHNALLGAGTATSAVGAGLLTHQLVHDNAVSLGAGVGGGFIGYMALRKLLESEKDKEKRSAAGPVLQKLLDAKRLSDVRDYKGKHQRLRQLIDKYPDDFFVDSMQGDIVGVTHRPTGFRMHAPIRVLPSSLRGRVDANEFAA